MDELAGASGTVVEEVAGASGTVVEEVAGANGTDSDVAGTDSDAAGGTPKPSGVFGLYGVLEEGVFGL